MKTQEIVINIWFIVDIGTNLCYAWRIKPYNLQGLDDEKLDLLNTLANTDYTTVIDRKLPDNAIVVYPDQEIKASLPIANIQYFFENNIDYFMSIIENELPALKQMEGEVAIPIHQKIPNNPLFTSTIVVENEIGETRPLTSEKNKTWYNYEKLRLGSFKE